MRQGRLRVSALSMLTTGILLLASPGGAADWISGYSDSTAIWLKGIEQELNSDEYRTFSPMTRGRLRCQSCSS